MAGDWIKMRGNLWDDPRVSKLCDITDCGEAQIVGGLYWLWATADQHTENGIMPGLTLRQIDRKTGITGFGAALCEIDWLADHPEGVRIIKFEEHNGTSAKRRCSEAQRKANSRNLSASDADNKQTDSGQGAELEKEKRREEKKEEKSKTKAAASPLPELLELGVDEQVASDWIKHRKAKRASSAQTVLDDRKEQAAIAGITLEDALRIEVSRGWQGFSADWLKPGPARASPPGRPEKFDPIAHVNRNRTRNQADERTIDIDEFGEPIRQVV